MRLNESITKRAIEKSLISFETINPRDYLNTKERIDDKVYGGGPGMLLKSEPLMKAIDDATSKFDRSESKIIYLSPKGKPFTQKTAETLASEKNIIFICGWNTLKVDMIVNEPSSGAKFSSNFPYPVNVNQKCTQLLSAVL